MNLPFIAFLALSAIVLIALVGTFIAVVCSVFENSPSVPRRKTTTIRDGKKITIVAKGRDTYQVTISPENKKIYSRRR